MEDQRIHDEFMEMLRRFRAVRRMQDALDASVRGRDKARWSSWLRIRRN